MSILVWYNNKIGFNNYNYGCQASRIVRKAMSLNICFGILSIMFLETSKRRFPYYFWKYYLVLIFS